MGPGSNKAYAGHVTSYVIISCIVAASGGALFGYDNGVTGGVVAMHPFLNKFFPVVDAVITGNALVLPGLLQKPVWSHQVLLQHHRSPQQLSLYSRRLIVQHWAHVLNLRACIRAVAKSCWCGSSERL